LPSDLDSLFALYSDPEVRRYFPEGTLTREETKEELDWFLQGHPDNPQLGLWATIHRETNQFIGRCGLLPWTIDQRPEVEVAYMLAKGYWGQGLGTEVARAILDYGFEQLRLSRLICLIDRDNQASIRVASKIGMTFEKEGQDDKGPFLLYARNKNLHDGTHDYDADTTQTRDTAKGCENGATGPPSGPVAPFSPTSHSPPGLMFWFSRNRLPGS
jgi:RimJ/RimL family protein N-acetyltransferase